MTISEKIDELRQERGMSKDGLEKAAGLSAGRLCKWLKRQGSPSVEQLLRIADVLEVLPIDLFNGTPVEAELPRRRFDIAAQRRILELAFRLGEEEATRCMMAKCLPTARSGRKRVIR